MLLMPRLLQMARSKRMSVVLLLCVILSSARGVYLSAQVPGEPRRLLDDDGRELYVHGTNAIVKGPPYFPILDHFDVDLSFSREDFEMMNRLGLNGVRLGVMWPGVAPEQRGQYNTTYLKLITSFVSMAAEHDVYVLLDMHQDVLSPQYCGEGIPQWAVELIKANDTTRRIFDFPVPVQLEPFKSSNGMGFPTRQECDEHGWGSYYFAVECSRAFEALYTSSDLLEAWGEFWAAVAGEVYSTAAGRSQVIGFELINEPWAGDIYSHPEQLIPGVADKRVLQPAYDALNEPLRNAAAQHQAQPLVFFAAVTFDDAVPAGFTAPPGGAEYADRSVFSYHFYTPPQVLETADHYFDTRVADGTRLQTGTFLSEFERPTNTEQPADDPFCNTTLVAEQHLQSWLFWEWKTFCRESNKTEHSSSIWAEYGACITGYGSNMIWNENGTTNALPMSKLARTYARRVAGRAIHNEFDAVTRMFLLKYEVDEERQHLPTEIYLSRELVYPDGYAVSASDNAVVFHEPSRNLLLVYADSGTVEVQVSPSS